LGARMSSAMPPARKFILIDHSLSGVGGHHYEYALHVLAAAAAASYKPVLGANRTFRDATPEGWDVHPVYTYGFMFRMKEPVWYRWLTGLRARVGGWIFCTKMRVLFSPVGLVWVTRDDLERVVQQQMPEHGLRFRVIVVLAAIYAVHVASAAGAFVRSAIPVGSYLRRGLAHAYRLVRAILAPLRLVIRPHGWMLRWASDKHRAQTFGRETARLLARASLAPGDIVFLPTVSEVEMLGVLEAFGQNRRAAHAIWHLLFRRNIYQGREADFAAQDEAQRTRRQAFVRFRHRAGSHRVFFYTDAEPLTVQYRRLGAPFRTLPIPHTHPIVHDAPRAEGPAHVVYVGDARAEKGYQYLPRLVGDLWHDYVAAGRAIFTAQSNFNIKLGDPQSVVARAQLEAFPRDRVRLIYEPLSAGAYAELLHSGTVVVLPYDRRQYIARSSGILVEALCAGIPVVVPSGTWLAQQFAGEVYAYHRSLSQRARILETWTLDSTRWRRHGQPDRDPVVDGELVCGGAGAHAYAWLAAPSGASHILSTFQFAPESRGAVVEVYAHQADHLGTTVAKSSALIDPDPNDGSGSVLIPIALGAARVWLGLHNPDGENLVYLRDVRVQFMAATSIARSLPISAVGVAYATADDLTRAVREVLDHREHYAHTAAAFAERMHDYHNAERLVSDLEREASGGLPEPALVRGGR